VNWDLSNTVNGRGSIFTSSRRCLRNIRWMRAWSNMTGNYV